MRRLHYDDTEFLVVAVETGPPPHRVIRVAVADVPDQQSVYSMRWSSYRNPRVEDDVDGGCFGDLEFAQRAIRHFIFERRRWQDVPEFKAS